MKWNDEVEMIMGHLDKVANWLSSVTGNAEKQKDWHTERNATRAAHYLELARTELYDMQFEEDPAGKRIWQKRINVD